MAVQYSVRSARGGAEAVEAAREIVDEIVQILKSGMDAHGRTGAVPWFGGAQLFRMARDDQTLEATPGIAHAEKFHAVEHRLECRLRTWFEDDPEAPVKSRFQKWCPGCSGMAGWRTVSTSGRVLSQLASARPCLWCCFMRTEAV